MITGKQIAAARSLLGWSQKDLDTHSGVSIDTIKNIEGRGTKPRPDTLNPIVDAFNNHGIEFIRGGVKEREDFIQVFEGDEGINRFYQDVANTAEEEGGEFLAYCLDQTNLLEHLNNVPACVLYRERMKKASGVKLLSLVRESEQHVPEQDYMIVRQLPVDDRYTSFFFYIYGDKIAVISQENTIKTLIIHQQSFVDLFKKQFFLYWNMGSEARNED